MKNVILFSVALAIVLLAAGCSKRVPGSGKFEMSNEVDSISAALGFLEAQQYRTKIYESAFDSIDAKVVAGLFAKSTLDEQYVEFREGQFNGFNTDIFRNAFINELAHGVSYFDEMSADVYLRMVFEKIRNQKEIEKNAGTSVNIENGAAFLAENANRAEVVSLESGLQYEIITAGNGQKPTLTDRVSCHYHGTLINGNVFDSSVERGEPAIFGVNQVIPGWTEALQMMPVGSKWKLFIPSHLAYGERGAGESIGANETLIFEVELLDIVK